MADINDIKKEIDKSIQSKREFLESIRFGRGTIKDKLKNKTMNSSPEPETKVIQTKSKEEIYNELKDKYRFAWKSPGYCSEEFNKIPVLKAKVLSTWDRERALMPERSYKAPKDFKGFNPAYHSRDFGEPSERLLPKQYRAHLEEVKKDYNDRVMRPSKYGPLREDILMGNLFYKEKERGWKRSNTTQVKQFGFDKKASYLAEQVISGKTTLGKSRV